MLVVPADGDGTERRPPADHGNGEYGAAAVRLGQIAQQSVGVAIGNGIARKRMVDHVLAPGRFQASRGEPGGPIPDGQRELRLDIHAADCPRAQASRLPIELEHDGALRPDQRGGAVRDAVEDVLHVQGRGQGLADRGERLDLDGPLPRVLIVARVVDRERHLRGDRHGEVHLTLMPGPGGAGVESHGADHLVIRDERNDDRRPEAEIVIEPPGWQ